MYVMQALPREAQGLASGIMNTLIRLASTLSMGIATAVYATYEARPSNETDPMLKFTRTFQVSIAFAGLGVLLVPFMRVGTQGHQEKQATAAQGDGGDGGNGLVEMQEDAHALAKKKTAEGGGGEKHDKIGTIDEQFWKKEFGGES